MEERTSEPDTSPTRYVGQPPKLPLRRSACPFQLKEWPFRDSDDLIIAAAALLVQRRIVERETGSERVAQKSRINRVQKAGNKKKHPVAASEGNSRIPVEILDSRRYRGDLEYRVRWRGEEEDNGWYPALEFVTYPELGTAFHARHPEKPFLDFEWFGRPASPVHVTPKPLKFIPYQPPKSREGH